MLHKTYWLLSLRSLTVFLSSSLGRQYWKSTILLMYWQTCSFDMSSVIRSQVRISSLDCPPPRSFCPERSKIRHYGFFICSFCCLRNILVWFATPVAVTHKRSDENLLWACCRSPNGLIAYVYVLSFRHNLWSCSSSTSYEETVYSKLSTTWTLCFIKYAFRELILGSSLLSRTVLPCKQSDYEFVGSFQLDDCFQPFIPRQLSREA